MRTVTLFGLMGRLRSIGVIPDMVSISIATMTAWAVSPTTAPSRSVLLAQRPRDPAVNGGKVTVIAVELGNAEVLVEQHPGADREVA